MTPISDPADLSWRIPAEGDPQLFRIGVMQVVVATLFFAAMVIALAPRDMLLAGLVAIVPLAGLLLWRNWRKRGSGRRLPDNVRIDARGVAWFDESGGEHLFARDQIEAFRIEFDEDTLRDVPALSLSLRGGYESQPIELHAPADPECVQHVLVTRLHLCERLPHEVEKPSESVGGVEFIEHDVADAWEFRGTRAGLLALCDRLALIGGRLLHFPVGARPESLRLGSVRLQFAPRQGKTSEIDGLSFFGTAEELTDLAGKLREPLRSADAGQAIDARAFDANGPLVRLRVQND